MLALAWGIAYLTWRVGWTHHGVHGGLYAVLLVAEAVGWVSLALFAFLAWRVPAPPTTDRTPARSDLTVDVLVPTYDEPVEVLRATLLGCRALRYPHTTWLLDDGRRPELAELARELGARYLTRPDNRHAKAGNINHALGHLEGDLVAVLDADHVPLPHFLDTMVRYFEDPDVVLAQAPHEFYNLDSIQHVAEDRHEQSLFFRVICPGKDRHNGAFWCGSGTVIRREPLVEIGGVQTATIAEDFHTTIVLHQRGWKTRYHEETLLLGLAPHDLDAFLLQRSRWARGNLRVFLTPQNPVIARGLRPLQRLSYLASLFHYFGGPQRLVLAAVLCTTLVTGWLPMTGHPAWFALLWAPWVALSLYATRVLGRGVSGPLAATRHGWMTMGVYTGAVLSLAIPGAGRFKVTPKMGSDEGGWRTLRRLRLLTACVAAITLAVLARALAAVGALHLPAMPPLAEAATLVIGTVEVAVIALVLRALVRRRQRRHVYRFPVDLRARLGDAVVQVCDLNHAGVGVRCTLQPEVGEHLRLTLRLPRLDGSISRCVVSGVVRTVTPPDGSGFRHVGIQFTELSDDARDEILEYCHVLRPASAAADGALEELDAARASSEVGRGELRAGRDASETLDVVGTAAS